MSDILKLCHRIRKEIDTYGSIHNDTYEDVGTQFTLDISTLDLSKEELEISEYYGDKWLKRCEDEAFHYKWLEYGLLHKVKEVKYFFKEGLGSRKLIIFSNDCISSIQYLLRKDRSYLLVHMRSSDVENLLPIDLLNISKILKRLDEEYQVKTKGKIISVTIGSAHYYLKGRPNE